MTDALDAVMSTLTDVENSAPVMEDTNVQTTIVETAPQMETETDASKKDPAFAHVPMTPELLAALNTARGTTALGPFVQQLLADKYGVTLPVKVNTRQRYQTDAERKQAKQNSAEKAANLRKALLAAHRARSAGDTVKLAQAEADIVKYS